MRISPVINNNYMSRANKRASVPSFKGEMNPDETLRALKMLYPTVSSCLATDTPENIQTIGNMLVNKYKSLGVNAAGLFIIPDQALNLFIRNQLSEEDAKKFKGFCVSVGDKNGPVETWTKAYESVVVLVPKSILSQQ